MTVHELKSWPEFFEAVWRGEKTAELRKNDRGFKVGDVLRLREWEPNTQMYSGREVRREVTHVMHGVGSVGAIAPLKGIGHGYCMLSMRTEIKDVTIADVLSTTKEQSHVLGYVRLDCTQADYLYQWALNLIMAKDALEQANK